MNAQAGTSARPGQGPRTFFGQPWGLATLSMTEVWERFSYYGMRALLVLYLVAPINGSDPSGPGLGYSMVDAVALYGCYSSLVYLMPLPGGWVADRITGPRRAILIGAVAIAIGHFTMVIPGETAFWVGLLVIATGTGLLKPSISATLGALYSEDDPRRDGGFSIFYMGINLGALLAPLVCGTLAVVFDWRAGFAAAGVGMLIGIGQYLLGSRSLGTAGLAVPKPAPQPERRKALRNLAIVLAAIAILVVGNSWLLGFDITDLTILFTISILGITVFYFWRLFANPSLTTDDRSKLRAFLGLFIGAAMFWAIYDQGGSTLAEFASEFSDRDLGWATVPTSWLQSINPVFIIMFAPVFAFLWTKLADRAPTTPMKFAIALVGVGLSFLVMVVPGLMADHGEKSALWWIVAVYLIQTWAELLLSPTGLSATTKLAPAGMTAQLLALWFLATAVGDSVGGQTVRVQEAWGFAGYFGVMGALAVVLGIAFVFASRPIHRLMEDVH